MLMQTRMGLPVSLATATASSHVRSHVRRQGFFQSASVGAGHVWSGRTRGPARWGPGNGEGASPLGEGAGAGGSPLGWGAGGWGGGASGGFGAGAGGGAGGPPSPSTTAFTVARTSVPATSSVWSQGRRVGRSGRSDARTACLLRGGSRHGRD